MTFFLHNSQGKKLRRKKKLALFSHIPAGVLEPNNITTIIIFKI
jgi:hypothetical protein